jgi:hypothetical protein
VTPRARYVLHHNLPPALLLGNSEKLPPFCPATMESGKEKDENRREKQQCCGFFATEIIVFISMH